MDICRKCFVLSGRGLCDELITRPEEYSRLWCVVVCDLETSRTRKSWSVLGRSATGIKKVFKVIKCTGFAVIQKHPFLDKEIPETRMTSKQYSTKLLDRRISVFRHNKLTLQMHCTRSAGFKRRFVVLIVLRSDCNSVTFERHSVLFAA